MKLSYFAILVFALGFFGICSDLWEVHSRSEPEASDLNVIIRVVLDSFVGTAQLFTLGYGPSSGPEHWAVTLARPLAALVFFSALFRIVAIALRESLATFRTSRLNDHTVIFGSGELAKEFAKKIRGDGAAVLVVDVDLVRYAGTFSSKDQFLARGSAASRSCLQRVNSAQAKRLIFADESGERNLIGLKHLETMRHGGKSQPTEAVVVVDDPLMFDILQREDRASSEDNDTRLIDTVLYSPSRMAARDFTLKARLASRALVGQQERVRLVIVGDGNVADDIMLDAIRHSHAIGLAGPLIQRVVTDVTIANNRLFRRCDAFRNSSKIASKSAPLSWAAEWEFIEWDLANSPVSTMIEQLQEIDASPITAIAVAHSDLVLNLSISISIREKLRKGELKCCTLMVYLPYQTSLDSIFFAAPGGLGLKEKHTELENTQETFSFGYFGRIESICDLDVFWGKPEALARLLHDAYRTQFFAEQPEAKLLKIEDLPENLHPWSALRDTYKRANRRAVEHLDSKLASLGLHKIDSPSLVERLSHSLRNDIEMEQLATLEHNSWRIERELDGWQYAQERDNVKKLHPDLKPYQELEDATKEFDREQIRFLFEFLLSRRKQLRNL